MKRALGLVVLLAAGCPPVESFSVAAEDVQGGALLGAHGDGDTLYFVGGQVDGSGGVIYRLEEGVLCREEGPFEKTVWWMHGVTEGEWYAVGDRGLILHEVGGVRSDESVATEATLFGVYVDGERVLAVGGDVRGTGLGEIWEKQGDAWVQLEDAMPEVLFKVWESWIVGQSVSYRFVGDELVSQPLPLEPGEEADLLTVVGRSDDEVFAVGGAGGSLFMENTVESGGEWRAIDVDGRCSFQPLNGVWTDVGEDVYIGGFFGGVARYDGSEFECPQDRVTQDDIHVVMKYRDEVFFAGGNLFQQSGNHGVIVRYGLDTEPLESAGACVD